jgi:Putative glycosyl/glycerophosphate transferases involved in teichoic acid biosynthesis TagF/TagB/EpsJ/RodC
MKKDIKEQLIQLLGTLQEAHQEIQNRFGKKEYQTVQNLLADCQESAVFIGNTIEQFEKNQEEIIHILEEYCERLFDISAALEKAGTLNGNVIRMELDGYIGDVCRRVKNEIKVLKAVFFPYKASMWTSLESIWRAAQQDAECDAKVVVIPYYILDSDGNKKELVYEADLFPKDVPIVHYSQYLIEQEWPDMVFIHNPYDGGNTVTRVPERYYSYCLKLYTKQLIYSPYYLMGYYAPGAGDFLCLTNGAGMADKMVVQSEQVGRICVRHHVPEEKLITLGSPKVDAIVEGMKKPKVYPAGWEQKLSGRKVFLLNTHLSYFIMGYDWQQKKLGSQNYAVRNHKEIFKQLLDREDCALIWRPHPLLKEMLRSRNLYSMLDFVEEWEQRISESENGVMDESGDYNIAFRLSDAFITSRSSLISEYMILGKPVYVYERAWDAESIRNSPVNFNHIYYIEKDGKKRAISEFIQMVLEGEDPLHEERMEDVKKAFSNLDGTIGRNVYEWLKDSCFQEGLDI